MDEMSYAVNDNTVIPLNTAHSSSKFFKSFFYRTMHSWNSLPLDIRKSCTLVKFKLEVKNFLWNNLLSNNSLEMGEHGEFHILIFFEFIYLYNFYI